jgi:hypothetical protein
MTASQPTASGVSRLLAKAGFERSNYGNAGVMWNEATPGYKVWKSWHQNAPQQPFVAVMHVIRSDDRGEDWKGEMRAELERYAAVIRAHGWPALVRDRGDDPPWITILTVVADKEASQ